MIHCTVLYFFYIRSNNKVEKFVKKFYNSLYNILTGKGTFKKNPGKGEHSLDGFANLLTATKVAVRKKYGEPYPKTQARENLKMP